MSVAPTDPTLLGQYANSPIITGLMEAFQQWFDPTANLQSFYSYVWNINTAQGFGLDIWGSILGVTRYLQVPSSSQFFGFNDGSNPADVAPFNQAPFYSGSGLTQVYALSDDAYRTLLLAKAFANICQTTIPMLNQLVMTLFGSYGQCYVTDGLNMTMTYVFGFAPTTVQKAIIQQSGVLPHPTGVAVTYTFAGGT